MAAERRRVLLLAPSFAAGAGGAERVFSILARNLDHKRLEIHLGLGQGPHSFLSDIPAEVVVHDLGISRMRYALASIARIARQVKPNVILSTVVYLNASVLLARRFLPGNPQIILREATTPSRFIAQEARHPSLWRWVYRRLYRGADRIVCLSDAVVQELAEVFGLPRDKLIRIYNPIDVHGLREKAALDGNPYSGAGPHLVCVGRLQRPKGVDILVSATHLVRKLLPHTTLTVVGEGPLETELRRQAQVLGLGESVSFAGFQHNPWRYIKHATVFVLPSRFEGMPNTLLEAIALGTPAVATDCSGGVREIKAQFPEIVLVPAENPESLAAAIVEICRKGKPSRGCADLGDFALDRVISNYSQLLLLTV
jgi:glycosyltransferase involved in cell wall biosynthesis